MGQRTTRSPRSPTARSSRVAVSRTMFSLSRMRLFCTKVRDEGSHNVVATHTAFLTSHGSSPPPAAAAVADSSLFLFSTTSALYSAISLWYLPGLRENEDGIMDKEGYRLIISWRRRRRSHTRTASQRQI